MTESPKEAIARVAERLFAERGFAAVSVRAIAAEAGVDPALVIRHYGSKEGLFLSTARMTGGFRDVLPGPLDTLGMRLVTWIVHTADEHTRGTYAALIWASSSEDVRQRLSALLQETLVGPLAVLLEGPDAVLRARLVAAQLDGLMRACWIAQDPLLLHARDEVVLVYGDLVQQLVSSAPAGRGRRRAPAARRG